MELWSERSIFARAGGSVEPGLDTFHGRAILIEKNFGIDDNLVPIRIESKFNHSKRPVLLAIFERKVYKFIFACDQITIYLEFSLESLGILLSYSIINLEISVVFCIQCYFFEINHLLIRIRR